MITMNNKNIMKKLTGILLTSVLVLGFTNGVGAQENDSPPEQDFHAGEKPLKSYKDPKTGVIIDVYNSFTKEPKSGFTPLTDEPKQEMMSATSGWDLVAQDYWVFPGDFSAQYDIMALSTGGDYMFRLPAHASINAGDPYGYAELWEDDGETGDDYVAAWYFYPSSVSRDYVVRSINSFVDGANGKAEFYTIHRANYQLRDTTYLSPVNYYD